MQSVFTFKRCVSFLILFVLQACGGGGPSENPSPEPRKGADLTVFDGPSDFSPSLSSDGKNMVFVSTRKDGYQIFKVTAEFGSAATASELMNTGVLENGIRKQETRAWLSPDGTQVFFTATVAGLSGSVSLHSVDFASGSTIVDLIKSADSIPNLVFSSDSKFAFTSITSGVETVHSGDVSKPAAITTVSKSDQRVLYYDSKNDLITFTQDKALTQKFTFYSNGTSVGTPSNIVNPNNLQKVALGMGDISYFVEDISSANNLIPILGDSTLILDDNKVSKKLDDLLPQYKQIQNDRVSLLNSDGTLSNASWTAYGQSINSISVSQKDKIGVFVSTERYLCSSVGTNNPDASTGRALVFVNFNNTKSYTQYIPVFDDQNKNFIFDPCTGLEAGSSADLVGIQSALINAASTASSYRIVYSTNFQQKSKLYRIDLVGGKTSLTPIN